MFENIIKFFKNVIKKEEKKEILNSKDAAKERLHLVLMQDRANVSTDFLELMKQEIIEVIKKYIEVDESAIDVRLTNKENDDGTNGAPALYANIPILNIKKENKKIDEDKEKDEGKEIEEDDKNSKNEMSEKEKENENVVEKKDELKEEIKEEIKELEDENEIEEKDEQEEILKENEEKVQDEKKPKDKKKVKSK